MWCAPSTPAAKKDLSLARIIAFPRAAAPAAALFLSALAILCGMYIPGYSREDQPAVLNEIIESHDFGWLAVSQDGAAPVGVHLPFMLDPDRGPHGTLIAHLARANPLAREIAANRPAVVVFQGPHAYISPSWYGDRDTVPTWNYVVVHAYGTPRVIDDASAIAAMLERLVERYERPRTEAWSLDEASQETMQQLVPAIVAFEIPLDRVEGKVKLGQNRDVADRKGVIAGLRREAGHDGEKLAGWMERYL